MDYDKIFLLQLLIVYILNFKKTLDMIRKVLRSLHKEGRKK